MDPTIKYYDDHAEEFRQQTETVPMEHLYAPFLVHIPDGGRILDAGCGVGRDSKAFLDRGYDVVSFDASETMVALTTALTGRPALRLRFQDVDFREEFDGIWACASLLHVSRNNIGVSLRRLIAALKRGGVIYASFKHGCGERVAGGRLFNDYNEADLAALITNFPELSVVDVWGTQDSRPNRSNERWLNMLARAVGH
jgi:SAM-dependent methyltransferase